MRTSPILILLSAGLASAAAAQSAPAVPPPTPPIRITTVPMVAPAPPQRARPSQPVPLGHLGQWITMKDYPADARKRREQGATGFILTIGTNGQPSACQVITSSGSPRLDAATCHLAMQNARFDPAIDSDGNTEVGYYPGLVNWRLDRMRDAPLPGTVTHTFIVEPDGSVTNCRIAAVTGSAKKQHRVGPEPCRHQDVFVSPDPAAVGKRKRVTEVETIAVSEVPATP